MHLSPRIINFLLDVELVTAPDHRQDTNIVYTKLSYSTNEYHAQFFLRYSSEHNLSAIENEINELLVNLNHPAGRDVAIALVALFSLLNKVNRTEQSVHILFKLIVPIKIKQYLFFPGVSKDEIHGLKFTDFEIGQINYSKFSNFIKNHSGSDYAARYESSHRNGIGIEMKSRAIFSIDIYKWMVLSGEDIASISKLTEEIVNYYLNYLALCSYQLFKDEFHRQQQLINSLFGVSISLNEFEYLGYQYVNVFYGFSGNDSAGWVLPIGQKVTNIFLPDPRVLKKITSFLTKEENDINEAQSPFKRLIEIAVEFFSNGQRSISRNNLSNAYVDYFVGLDFLLAPDTEKSKKLKQRISLLTHEALGKDFTRHLERLDYLYDVRSEYVHNGKSVDPDALIELRNISRIIIFILIRLHKRNNGNANAYLQWLTQIDTLVQEIYRGIKPNAGAYAKIGVVRIDTSVLSKDLSDKQSEFLSTSS